MSSRSCYTTSLRFHFISFRSVRCTSYLHPCNLSRVSRKLSREPRRALSSSNRLDSVSPERTSHLYKAFASVRCVVHGQWMLNIWVSPGFCSVGQYGHLNLQRINNLWDTNRKRKKSHHSHTSQWKSCVALPSSPCTEHAHISAAPGDWTTRPGGPLGIIHRTIVHTITR